MNAQLKWRAASAAAGHPTPLSDHTAGGGADVRPTGRVVCGSRRQRRKRSNLIRRLWYENEMFACWVLMRAWLHGGVAQTDETFVSLLSCYVLRFNFQHRPVS